MIKNLLFYMILFSSCVSGKTQKAISIELTILPSSGGGKGYTLMVEKDTIKTMLRGLGLINNEFAVTNIKNEKKILLGEAQKDSIFMLMNEINTNFRSNKDAFTLDCWIYIIAINKQEVARFNSFTLLESSENQQLECLKKLTITLLKLSPLEIDLKSF